MGALAFSEMSELVIKVGFVTSVCILSLYIAYKSINYYFENKKKSDSSSLTKDQRITNQFLDDKKEANDLLTREREALNKRLTDCEHELKECNVYIRNELTNLINKNIESMQQVNVSVAQINDNIILTRKEMSDLKNKIGKIKEAKFTDDEEVKPYEKNFKHEDQASS